jgi:hypothetical protein
VELLTAVRRRLAHGGVVALSTPNQRSLLEILAGAVHRASRGRIAGPLRRVYMMPHFLYFTEATLADTARRAGLVLVHCEREMTDLRRLALSRAARLALEAVFRAARAWGLENRLFAIARAARDEG